VADFDAIQQHRDQLLNAVHQEVEAYLNTPDLVFESDEDGFPNIHRLSGEYYIGDESYSTEKDPVRFVISISARCLEKPWRPGQTEFDYLGLEVWLECRSDDWELVSSRNVDSSAI